MSENLGFYVSKKWAVTAANWEPFLGFTSYEVGIRNLMTHQFYLVQNRRFNVLNVLIKAKEIFEMLENEVPVKEVIEVFSQELWE